MFDLEPGEDLAWTGSPNTTKLLVRADYVWIPIGLAFALLTLVSLIAAFVALLGEGSGGAFVGVLAAILFGMVAFELTIGRVARRRRAFVATEYAITNRRALRLAVKDGRPKSPRPPTITLDQVPLSGAEPKLIRQYDQRGDIVVGNLRMENLDDAAVVFEILSGQIAAARQG